MRRLLISLVFLNSWYFKLSLSGPISPDWDLVLRLLCISTFVSKGSQLRASSLCSSPCHLPLFSTNICVSLSWLELRSRSSGSRSSIMNQVLTIYLPRPRLVPLHTVSISVSSVISLLCTSLFGPLVLVFHISSVSFDESCFRVKL